MKPKAGDTFIHRSKLDLKAWPDKRKALMKVTRVAHGSVYFTYADEPSNKGAWHVPLDDWLRDYSRPAP